MSSKKVGESACASGERGKVDDDENLVQYLPFSFDYLSSPPLPL